MMIRVFLALAMTWPHVVARNPVNQPKLLQQRQGTFVPSPGNFPPTGDDTIAGGIFGISVPDLDAYINRTGADPSYTGAESPLTSAPPTPGSGPYPAGMTTTPSLPNHTIYAPLSAPNTTMPFLAWANGACATDGSLYQNLLLEIASHGYVVAADGPPGGLGTGTESMVPDMRASLDWAMAGGAAAYGDVDTHRVAVAGQSCGGLEALATAYRDPRVTRILMFNIGIFQDDRRYLLREIDVPVAYFMGGRGDLGFLGAEKDYHSLNRGLPALIVNLDTGHGGTYIATNGGKFGTAAVAYLEWQFRHDARSREVCLDAKSKGSLVSENWSVRFKNWL